MQIFGGNRDQTFQNCWRQLPFSYKFYFLFVIGYNIISMFISFLFMQVIFTGYYAAHELQLWRILFTFLPAGSLPMGFLNILVNFWWLLPITPPIEKKLSSSFMLVEIFLQSLMVNLVLLLIGVVLFDIFSVNPQSFDIYNLGFSTISMIFIWYQVSQNPDQHTTFCCMPCLIPMKWIPIILLGFSFFMSSFLLAALVVSSILGYLQFMHYKRRFIKLPLRFYRRIDSLLPNSITNRPDYVRVQNVEADLQSQCYVSAANAGVGANPFNRNQNRVEQSSEPNKVEVIGKGVSIGGSASSNVQNFRGVWAQKNDEIEIQPVPPKDLPQGKQDNQGIDPDFFNSNDSKINLNLNHSDDKSEEQFAQKDEKKVSKQNLLE